MYFKLLDLNDWTESNLWNSLYVNSHVIIFYIQYYVLYYIYVIYNIVIIVWIYMWPKIILEFTHKVTISILSSIYSPKTSLFVLINKNCIFYNENEKLNMILVLITIEKKCLLLLCPII